jgi:cation transport regulator
MPYRTNINLPPRVKKFMAPTPQTIWRKAFNSAYNQYGKDETRAAKVAWSAIKKSGYKKNIRGRYSKAR